MTKREYRKYLMSYMKAHEIIFKKSDNSTILFDRSKKFLESSPIDAFEYSYYENFDDIQFDEPLKNNNDGREEKNGADPQKLEDGSLEIPGTSSEVKAEDQRDDKKVNYSWVWYLVGFVITSIIIVLTLMNKKQKDNGKEERN